MGLLQWTKARFLGKEIEEFELPPVVTARIIDCGANGFHLDLRVGDRVVEQFYDDAVTARQKAMEIADGTLVMALGQLKAIRERREIEMLP